METWWRLLLHGVLKRVDKGGRRPEGPDLPASGNPRKKKNRQKNHSLHQSRRRGHLGPRHRITPPPAKQKHKRSIGIRRVTSSTPFLTSALFIGLDLLSS